VSIQGSCTVYATDVSPAVLCILAVAVAVMAALGLGAFAHADLGVARATIRTDAIAGMAVIGLALAAGLLRKTK
jgi:hypothetical protein